MLYYCHQVGEMSLFQYGFAPVPVEAPETVPVTVANHMPQLSDVGLSIEEHANVSAAVSDLADPAILSNKRKPRGKYTAYSDEARAKIGKYASQNGNERARQKFLTEFPKLTESTVRNFKKMYLQQLKEERKKNPIPNPVTKLPVLPKGRPPLMLSLDQKLIKFLKAVRSKGGVVNIHVVRATAQALIQSNPSQMQHYARFDMPRTWVQSIYRRMGYSRRLGTTGRPPIPPGLYEECRLDFLRDIDNKVKLHTIPPELIINSDQTPSSYVSVGKQTMNAKGEKSVSIEGLSDKRNITLTFSVTLSGKFLPMQIIYGGKTNRSQPRGFVFPKGFCVSQNPKHWSNEEETLKLVNEIINPYIIQTREKLKLPPTQKALIIWDVFKGQMTDRVKNELGSLNIDLVPVPANMTHFFQPLDLTVNRAAKNLMKKEFIAYYSRCVQEGLDTGKQLENIEVDLRLSVIKPLHAQWLVSMFNFFTTTQGRDIIYKGWKRAGVSGLIDGSTVLPPVDPFEEIMKD